MIFNSIEFAIFLPIVFSLYWLLNSNLKLQNLFIVVASFFFYGWWDWRFLLLLFGSAVVDFIVGILLEHENGIKKRKMLLMCSVFVNLGILCFFKYFNFFAENFLSVFTLFGFKFQMPSLRIVLPVGISFYTFQALSYTIEVYRGKLKPTKNIIDYFAFISFFPVLVAGPIERATQLLPQFYTRRVFNYSKAVDGLRQILWGLFKKVVIADNCALLVTDTFTNYEQLPASSLVLGALFFAMQIYTDFSGYSDIALGTSRMFGFDLMRNFAYPYFSRDMAEFWRRWHISLSTWFRDYVYIPLGGSKGSKWQQIRNVFIIFLLSGFWHGANWTFLIWGAINALCFLPLLLLQRNRSYTNIVAENSFLPSVREFVQMGTTFSITTLAWIFFRSPSVFDAVGYIKHFFSMSLFTVPASLHIKTCLFICIMLVSEWFQRRKNHALNFDGLKLPVAIRYTIYYVLVLLIIIFGGSPQEFIYFQF